MSGGRRQERSPEKTKKKLIESAKLAFARHGFHGATVQQIADNAGVNVSMISHHFGGKRGIYRACLSSFGTQRLATLDQYMAPPATVEEFKAQLRIMVNELLGQHVAEPELVFILLRDVNDPDLWDTELEQHLFGFTTKLATIFAEAKARSFVRQGADPMVVASIIYLAFSGLIQVGAHVERMTGVTLQDPAARAAIVDQVLDVVLHGALCERSEQK